jgi:pyruvate dehydrogenase E1 component alpha subunit
MTASVDPATGMRQAERLGLFEEMLRIRTFEKAAINLMRSGQIRGSLHPCTGQEAVSVGVCGALRPDDLIFFTYRGHGHALAKGLPLVAGFAELAGRTIGSNHGWGGSMLFADFSRGILGGNTIVAGSVPIAVGRAVAVKHQGGDQVVVSFFGDGATNQGAWHEAMVLAAMWQVPIIFVCENNEYSEMTPISFTVPLENLADRGAAYGIPGVVVDGADVEAVRRTAIDAVERARGGGGPILLEMKTFRLDGHFVGDDQRYIPKEQQEDWARRDPIATFSQRLNRDGVDREAIDRVRKQVNDEIESAIQEALAAPYPDAADLPEVAD